MNNIVSSDLGLPKDFEKFGLSVQPYRNANEARGHTYTTRIDGYPPTPFISSLNPFNAQILASKNVLEVGGGVGRNLPFVMEQTKAYYYNVDPNEEMLRYFWDIQDPKWQPRVTLCHSFEELPDEVQFDFIIVTFVFQHIGFRPGSLQMNVTDITKEAMKHGKPGTVWFVFEHEREEQWQDRWLSECGITPAVYFKPGGDAFGGGTIPYPEFEIMTHRGNDNNIIIFQQP